jgi:O-methyltransferase
VTKLTFDQISTEQALAIADGLIEAEQYSVAAQVLQSALRSTANRAMRNRLHVRLGLVNVRNKRTAVMHDAHRLLERGASQVFVGEGLATWSKTMAFYDDERFIALAEKHAGLLPLPNWHWNLQTVLWAVRQAKGLDGDLMELGVFKGHTTLFCAEYVDFAAWPKRWRLYDTFDGIPDDQVDPNFKTSNQVYKGTFSFEEVRDRFAHIPNVEVIKGRVPEVLAENCPEKIAFIHMDLNNATAEIQALDALFDKLVPGGVIVFDDYGWAVSRAQFDAENAWFAERGLQILPLPTGQGLFIKR